MVHGPKRKITQTLSDDALFITNGNGRSINIASGAALFGGNLATKGPKPWVDVTAYSATGDGSTDDTSTIQSAIDACPTGGILFFPKGTYLVSSNLVSTKQLYFLGAGRGSVLKASGTGLTAIVEMQSGAAGSVVENLAFYGSKTGVSGQIQRGVYINGSKKCTTRFCFFSGPNSSTGLNFGVDINGQNSNQTRVLFCDFERLVSSSGQGTAVLVEASDHNFIYGCDVDSSEFTAAASASSAIFFASTIGQGSNDNYIGYCRIQSHPQVGVSINSTTYNETQGSLGECNRNVIEECNIHNCNSSSGGDASSGIAMVGNSNFNRIIKNKLHHNGHSTAGGFGVVLSGSQGTAKDITNATNATPIVITTSIAHGFTNGQQVGVSGVVGNTAANGTFTVANAAAMTFELSGSSGNGAYISGGKVGLVGSPKIDEKPTFNWILDNDVYQNQDDGVRIKGATNTRIQGNQGYENGQRTANTFRNLYITIVGGAVNAATTLVRNNIFTGTQPKYQIEIGSSVSGTEVVDNRLPSAATGAYLDGGTSTIWGPNITPNNLEFVGPALFSASVSIKGPKPWIDVTTYGATGDGVTDDRVAIASAVAAIPSGGGVLYFPAGTYITTSSSPLLSITDKNGVTIVGQGASVSILKQLGTGNVVDLLGTSEIVNTIFQHLSVNGNNAAAKGIITQNMKDGIIQFCTISGCLNHAIDVTGADTLNGLVYRCRISAGSGALSAGRGLNVRAGTSWTARSNYFNIGGTSASVRYETAVDVRDHDNFLSDGNIWDGATTGIRSNSNITSINEFWDTDATTGITGYCYVHTANNPICIIQPRGISISKIDLSGFNRRYLTLLGSEERGVIGGVTIKKQLTPSAITADQNDYSPTDGFVSSIWRLSSDASRTITGIAAGSATTGAPGQELTLINVGSNNIVLAHQDTNSSASNRVISPSGANVTLLPNASASLMYDDTTARWRLVYGTWT